MPALNKLLVSGALAGTVFFAFINMIISAVLVANYNSGGYPSTSIKNVTRYTLFVSILNLLAGGAFVFFVLSLSTSIIASIVSLLGFTFVLWIFWIASAASVQSSLGGNCSGITHCTSLRAMEAFSFLNFILFFCAFALVAFFAFKSTRNGSGLTSPLSA